MFNEAPSALIPSYASSGGNITIPIASLPSLSSGEADASTGDSRSVLMAILDHYYTTLKALPTGEKPAKMTIRRSTSERTAGLTRTYVVTVVLEGDLEVAPES